MTRSKSIRHTILDDMAAPYIQRMVDQLKEKGSIVSPAIEAAFRHVPRHPFIDHYYMQHRAGPTMKWNLVTPDQIEQADQWLARIYTDDALITLMSERSQPTSSSSAPCAMADMLESLDLHPGMRVLEIGTGTGYNAAILAYLTGDPHLVFTVDLYPALTEKARARLDRVATLIVVEAPKEAQQELYLLSPSNLRGRRSTYHLILQAQACFGLKEYTQAALLAEEALAHVCEMYSRVNLERIKLLYKQLQQTPFRNDPEVERLGYLLSQISKPRL